jgi:hypothetical protein
MNDDQDDDDSMAQSTSVGGHPKLATIAQGLKSLDESQEAMVGAITRVNAIREKLFSIDESSSTSGTNSCTISQHSQIQPNWNRLLLKSLAL